MEKLNKLSLPITIIISSIILGSFYYASEIRKIESVENQQKLEIQSKIELEKRNNCKIEINEKISTLENMVDSSNATPEQAQFLARSLGLTDENNYVLDKNTLIEKCLNSNKE